MANTIDINNSKNLIYKDKAADSMMQNTGFCSGKVSTDDNKISGYGNIFKEGKSLEFDQFFDDYDEMIKARNAKENKEIVDGDSNSEDEKEAAKEISKTVTSDEIKLLEQMGIDVTNVDFVDLLGMVNSLRSKAHKEETTELLAGIKLSNNDYSDVSVLGNKAYLPGVEGEIELGDKELTYLLKNEKALTKENIYKAHFSSVSQDKIKISNEQFDALKNQIENVITQSGNDVNDETLGVAKYLLESKLPVTASNIINVLNFNNIRGNSEVNDLAIPLNNEEIINDQASKLYEDVKSIDTSLININVVDVNGTGVYSTNTGATNGIGGNTVFNSKSTIASILHYINNHQNKYSGNTNINATSTNASNTYVTNINTDNLSSTNMIDSTDADTIMVKKQLEEIRLMMTKEASISLIKKDLYISTRELSDVVDALKQYENSMLKKSFDNAGVQFSSSNIEIYNNTTAAINELSHRPMEVIAKPLDGTSFTVNNLNSVVIKNVQASYEAARTVVRADMGDSIKKAFGNTDFKAILEGLDIGESDEAKRAVRILSLNNIDINKENMDKVMYFDQEVQTLFKSFYPEAVLGLIKDNINPLDVDISKLNKLIKEKNYNKGVTEVEDFAKFIVDMDKSGIVDESERSAFIGVYRLLNKMQQSDNKESGWMLANNSEFTLSNVLAAIRSDKSLSKEYAIDDSFGLLQDKINKGTQIDNQISEVFNKKEKLMDASDINNEVEELIRENDIKSSAVNIEAINYMFSSNEGIFKIIYEALKSFKPNNTVKNKIDEVIDNQVDDESEKIIQSLKGVDIAPELLLEGQEKIIETLENLENSFVDSMYEAINLEGLSTIDLASLKTVNAGINVLTSMARNERYQVPIKINNQVNVVNVTINRSKEQMSQVETWINTNNLGKVYSNFTVTSTEATVSIHGSVTSDSSDGNLTLKSLEIQFQENMTMVGVDASNLKIGEINHNLVNGNAKSDELYNVAMLFVKTIGEVL